MLLDRDHYEAYYSEKLWNLIPAIYRVEDTDAYDAQGPLREIVNRIGKHAAILRRSLDRMWEDQSIESCDDWLIPYVADLLMTRLAPSLDSRGQRLNVAKTIYYRRRKGTVGVIEELASDITGWETRVVEFFRRMARNRHLLDPEIGPWVLPNTDLGKLQRAQGLIGPLSRTGIGGWADLRSVAGASKCGTAFDEYFYTADVRHGQGRTGWHNISHVGIFAWRLRSFDVQWSNPVAVEGCPGHYTFDPTGRQIPLFAGASRQENAAYGDKWASPKEWQLPTPISNELLAEALANPDDMPLWAITDTLTGETDRNSLAVYEKTMLDYVAVETPHVFADSDDAEASGDPEAIVVYPEIGRFRLVNPAEYGPVFTTYHFGFASTIGAGPYDRRRLGDPTIPDGTVEGGGSAFDTALANVDPTDGEVVIGDSLTYNVIRDVANIDKLVLQAENRARPVLRLATGTIWTFTGNVNSSLTLEGLHVAGADLVLAGDFDTVTVRCCTIDPGNWDDETDAVALAVDGQELSPSFIRVTGQVRRLVIERSICGPIAVAAEGAVETISATDSIIQSITDIAAVDTATGTLELERVTVLGAMNLHRLYASSTIMNDVVKVEDTQHGCVRFSAWVGGSVIPSAYECVRTKPRSMLFNSRQFGQPAYCQLREGVDNAIVSGAENRLISSGAEDGSEMGAFSQEKNPIKERSLLFKLEEFLPLGLAPVIIYAT